MCEDIEERKGGGRDPRMRGGGFSHPRGEGKREKKKKKKNLDRGNNFSLRRTRETLSGIGKDPTIGDQINGDHFSG